jgi:chaperone LolA
MNKIVLMVLVLMMACVGVFAQDELATDLTEILSQMEGIDKTIENLEVDFKQDMTFIETKEKQSSQGHLAFMKPNNIFIERKSPQEQKIYINSKTMTIYTPKTFQAIISPVQTSEAEFSPTSFINFGGNWKNLQKTNTIKYLSQDEQDYVLEIIPKNKKNWVMSINISKQDLNPNKITVRSDTLLINVLLTNYKVNSGVDKNLFRFKAAKGIEVIELN